jgi:hypothetical protein
MRTAHWHELTTFGKALRITRTLLVLPFIVIIGVTVETYEKAREFFRAATLKKPDDHDHRF